MFELQVFKGREWVGVGINDKIDIWVDECSGTLEECKAYAKTLPSSTPIWKIVEIKITSNYI